MELGILVMIVIILVALAVVFAVMYFGSQHDPHTAIRSVESSRSVQTLITQEEERVKAMEARQKAEEEAQKAAEKAQEMQSDESPVTSQLGDEDERAKRREAALARKAARQAQRTTE